MSFRSQKRLVSVAIVCILLAGIIFYYNNFKIPEISRQIEIEVRKDIDINAMPKQRVAIISDKSGISKYTELTDKIINEKIKIVDIPIKYVVDGAISDASNIIGKIAKEDLRFGEQIVQDNISNEKKWFGDYQRLKEYAVSSIVADEVKSGNIIDIIVSYDNGSYDVIVPKIKVIKLIKQDENQILKKQTNENGLKTDDFLSYTLIIAVDEQQYSDLELAKKLGKLETRLYLDESQPSSKKTFNYANAVGWIKKLDSSGKEAYMGEVGQKN